MGHYDMPIDQHPSKEQARDKTNHYVTGRDGGRDIDLRKFALEGMRLYGPLAWITEGRIGFSEGLKRNLDAADEVLSWIDAGQVDLLAFNEHTDSIARDIKRGKIGEYLGRTRLDQASFIALFEGVRARRDAVPAAVALVAEAARRAVIPMASHDDNSPAMRDHYRALGCRLSEFPLDRETACSAVEAGETVILGGPNVVRGGSHAARLPAAESAEAGLCSVLTSDYYYPTLLQAAFILAGRGALPFAECWALVSRNPARAAGLADRGEIAPGRRADLILVDDSEPALPRVVASYVAGQLRFAAVSLS